jgi:hypothetical protein
MGLIACPICARQISEAAASCPGCGHPNRSQLGTTAAQVPFSAIEPSQHDSRKEMTDQVPTRPASSRTCFPEEADGQLAPIRVRFRLSSAIIQTGFGLTLAGVPILLGIPHPEAAGNLLLALVLFSPVYLYFLYYGGRAMSRKDQLILSRKGVKGRLIEDRELNWDQIESVKFYTLNNYESITIRLRNGGELSFSDTNTLTLSTSRMFELMKYRLETGVFSFPPKSTGFWSKVEKLIRVGLSVAIALVIGFMLCVIGVTVFMVAFR